MFPDATPLLGPSPHLFGNGSSSLEATRGTANQRPDPTKTRSSDSNQEKRKQTLMTILDALQELSASKDLGNSNQSAASRFTEEDPHEPAIDIALQSEGAEAFEAFQERIKRFDKELRNFANATRQLGSSAGILHSSFHLRTILSQVLYLFRENAAELFPKKVKKNSREHHDLHNKGNHRHWGLPKFGSQRHHHKHHDIHHQLKKIHKHNPHLSHISRSSILDELDPEHMPSLFKTLARELKKFMERLNEFPEFHDEAVNSSFEAFEGDLNYWASTLEEFEGQLRFPSVGRYVHDLSTEMGEHIENIIISIAYFIEVGVPMIRFVQKHGATNLLNLSTVATFFSAVTATTIQFSYQQKETALQEAVNTFWFASLVFSIASAVNSLLGLTWKQAMYRSPGHRVPWWVLIWIKRSPLIFLVISVAAFSMGLVLFTWSSPQSLTTAIITSVFTCLSSFGLIAVSLWFASERWAYTRHRGQRWLADVLAELSQEVRKSTGIEYLSRVHSRHVAPATRNATRYVRRLSSALPVSTRTITRDEEQGPGPALPFANSDIPIPVMTFSPIQEGSPPPITREMSDGVRVITPAEQTLVNAEPEKISEDISKDEVSSPEKSQSHNSARMKWTRAAKMAIMSKSLGSVNAPVPVNKRQMTLSTSSTGGGGRSRQESLEPVVEDRQEKMNRLVKGLQKLTVSHEFSVHQALVRHLQFSQDGKWLATCSWDRTSHLFKAFDDGEELCTHHKKLFHPSGAGGRVAWSPDGQYLLTKLTQSIKVWSTEDGVCQHTIRRPRHVQSVVWMPAQEGKDPSFMSVETGAVCTIDLRGTVLATYELDRLQIYEVVVTPNAQRFLGVATLLESKDKLKPVKSRPENRIIVYNLEEKSIESQVPVLNEVRDITLGGKNGDYALISYENMTPPQLWKLQMVRDDVRMVLTTTYMPRQPVPWAGSSYFGGKEDQLVLCAGKAGDVHIWDRESGRELHHFWTQEQSSGDLTAIAWNPLSEGTLMLATGTHDGVLKIWTAEVPPKVEGPCDPFVQSPSRSSSPDIMLSDEELVELPDPNEADRKLSERGALKLQMGNLQPQTQNSGPVSPNTSVQEGQLQLPKEKRPLSGLNRLGSQIRHSYFGGKKKDGGAQSQNQMQSPTQTSSPVETSLSNVDMAE